MGQVCFSAASRGRLASWCQWVRVFSHTATPHIRERTHIHRKPLNSWREWERKTTPANGHSRILVVSAHEHMQLVILFKLGGSFLIYQWTVKGACHDGTKGFGEGWKDGKSNCSFVEVREMQENMKVREGEIIIQHMQHFLKHNSAGTNRYMSKVILSNFTLAVSICMSIIIVSLWNHNNKRLSYYPARDRSSQQFNSYGVFLLL